MANSKSNSVNSLNPCFNGRYSQSSDAVAEYKQARVCLNPCFNGRYSQRALFFIILVFRFV